MFAIFRNLLMIAVLATLSTTLKPGPALADDDDGDGYWKNYWRWYDNDYRPHYYRQHRNYRNYDRDYGRDYGYRNRYSDSPYTYGYSPYMYGYRGDFDDRYRRDRDYYRDRRNSVDIGGLRLEWR